MRIRLALAVLLAVLAAAGASAQRAAAAPGLILGVDDDTARWMGMAGVLNPIYHELGLRAIRVTLQWRPGAAALSPQDRTEIDRAVLATWGFRLVLVVDGPADRPPADAISRSQYCSYSASIMREYPGIQDIVIWTEPNSSAFWRPQTGAAAAYEALLASCWDAIHAVRGDANVIAASAPHRSPVAWFLGVGAALRASGRTQRILDTIGHNAYPDNSAESPYAKHRKNLDQGDYDRLVATLNTAFAGTAQPPPGRGGVTIWYMEDGFQSKITSARHLYTGTETDRFAVDEGQQANLVSQAMKLAYCQPYVGAWFNFELRDETLLAGWQSGLLRADWTAKPSFYTYRDAAVAISRRAVTCA